MDVRQQQHLCTPFSFLFFFFFGQQLGEVVEEKKRERNVNEQLESKKKNFGLEINLEGNK